MSENLPDLEAGYDREVIDRVWSRALVVRGNDPAVWRKDEFGAWMHRADYRNRRSEFGWEIADPAGAGGSGTDGLRGLQWQNYLDYMVAARHQAIVTADGLRNARRLV
ncbi:MAG: hypothetical protein KDK99_20345 [Verrucomicrobiales bacterium]|nr:hypothetical protein [Verrucomicrobiales bacterium]